jgi:hypothetical protein
VQLKTQCFELFFFDIFLFFFLFFQNKVEIGSVLLRIEKSTKFIKSFFVRVFSLQKKKSCKGKKCLCIVMDT